MGHHYKSGLCCLIFALAVVTSYAENPEEPDESCIEWEIPNEEGGKENLNYDSEFEDPSTRVKRDISPGWASGNPFRPTVTFTNGGNRRPGQGAPPQGGQGRGVPPQGGQGRGGGMPPQGGPMQPPLNPSQTRMDRRMWEIQQFRHIQSELSFATAFYQQHGMNAGAARARAERDNPHLMAQLHRLRQAHRRLSL